MCAADIVFSSRKQSMKYQLRDGKKMASHKNMAGLVLEKAMVMEEYVVSLL
jgi:accessory colonization factor AcfC